MLTFAFDNFGTSECFPPSFSHAYRINVDHSSFCELTGNFDHLWARVIIPVDERHWHLVDLRGATHKELTGADV